MKILVVVDMQNDFIDGALGTVEAISIVPNVIEKIKNFDGKIFATRDTHLTNYLESAEGRKLPVTHCVKGTEGWELHPEIGKLIDEPPIDKPTFGSTKLGDLLRSLHKDYPIESITLIGLCTDICIISNAMLLKAFLPEVAIIVDASCCAGVTPKSHRQALDAMKACQIDIINE